jgi:hypothetical protein
LLVFDKWTDCAGFGGLQVLDVAHRRQVAQEGLMGECQRTWSFATDSKQGSEIATVPEEEIELSPFAASNDQNV